MTAISDAVNAALDGPGPLHSVHVPHTVAAELIAAAGGLPVSEGWGRWRFADGFITWETDEALRYALEILAQHVSPVIPERAQLALGELGEAAMKDGPACHGHIERAVALLRETGPV